jgi:hypothetical protein
VNNIKNSSENRHFVGTANMDAIKQDYELFELDEVPDEDDFLDENGKQSSSIAYPTYNTSSIKQSNIIYGSVSAGG